MKCREMQRHAEMKRNVEKLREMQRSVEKCREIQRNADMQRYHHNLHDLYDLYSDKCREIDKVTQSESD